MAHSRTRISPRIQLQTARDAGIRLRAEEIGREELDRVRARRQKIFGRFLLLEWVLAVAIAVVWAPLTWLGRLDLGLALQAIVYGGAVNALVVAVRPLGPAAIRRVMVVGQMLLAALFVHVLGGRDEVFAVAFMALALIAAFRDRALLHLGLVVGLGVGLVHTEFWPEDLYRARGPDRDEIAAFAALLIVFWAMLTSSLDHTFAESAESANRQAELEHMKRTVEVRVDERTRELVQSRELYRQLVETTRTIPFEVSLDDRRFSFVGPQVAELLGVSPETATASGFIEAHVHREDLAHAFELLSGLRLGARAEVELRLRRVDGVWVWVRFIASLHREFSPVESDLDLVDAERRASPARSRLRTTVRGVMFDVTDTRRLEMELRQAQKLESVGRLASGVAHEINTPVQFVSDSVHFLRDAITDLTRGMETYRDLARRTEAVLDESRASRPLATVGAVSGAEEADLHALAMAARRALESDRDKDIDYLVDNAPRALDRALDGLARVATIVRSMKQFAHPDQKDMCAVDINEGICSTLVIASNEYKYVADVETDLAELPPVVCHGGDINQVVLNLVINAAHAIAEKAQVSGERGRIRLATRRDGGFVTISVTDTGTGIPKAMHERVFEPFFTTKEVGRGTGQGLSIARATVVEKHHGELWFETEEGVGTTFFVRLPMHGDTAPAALPARPSGGAMDDKREAA